MLPSMTSAQTHELELAVRDLGRRVARIRALREDSFLREHITDIVESLYDIGTVTAVYEIFGGFNNRSFGIDALKGQCKKTYFMRKYRYGISAKEIGFEHALIRHAINNGFTICAGVVKNTHGETFVKPANSRSIFAIYENLPGNDKYTWDNPDLTDAEFKSAGRVLSTFHNAVQYFNPERLQRTEPPILALWPRLTDKLMRLAQQKQIGDLHADYAVNLQSLVNMIARNPFDPTEAEGMPVIPIHCDYHPGNLKWSNEQVVGVFDFDWSKMDLRLFDVGLAVIYFCSRWDNHRDGELRCDKFELFLRSYQNELRDSAGLGPLTPVEKILLPKILKIANIYLAHWGVTTYKNTEGANDYEYLSFLKHSVRLMHWLETHQTAIVKTITGTLS